MSNIQGPSWNLDSEYTGTQSEKFSNDFNFVNESIEQIKKLNNKTDINTLKKFLLISESANEVLHDMQTYTKCLRSIDFRDSQADEWDNKLSKLSSNLNSESIVLNNYLLRCSDEIISEITSFTEFSRFGFYLKKKRYLKNYLLSDSEESMLVSIRKNAYVAWSDLHKDISGSIKLNYQKNGSICQTGLAQALTDTRCDNSETRKNAWVAIQKNLII